MICLRGTHAVESRNQIQGGRPDMDKTYWPRCIVVVAYETGVEKNAFEKVKLSFLLNDIHMECST